MGNAKRSLINGHRLWILPAILGVLALCAPWLGASTTVQRTIILISLLTMTVSGLNLAWGYGGELAMGQIVMYALGAYISGYLATQGFDMTVGMLAAVLASCALGLIVGLPSLRVGGWGLAMASFFLVMLIPATLTLLPEQTGGLVGMLGIPVPVLFGHELAPKEFYVLVIGCALLWLAAMRNFVTSREGAALRVIRESPVLATSVGLSVPRLKLTAYVLGALPAGLAGSLFVYVDRFLAPEYFNWTATTLIIAAAVLGGLETVYGAAIAATILTWGTEKIGAFDHYSTLIFGVFLIVGGAVILNPRVRHAMLSARRRAHNWRVDKTTAVAASSEIPSLQGPTLVARSVSKTFGGTQALSDVTIEARPGSITALIGANGSGKTTLLNVMSGYYRPDSGTISLDDQDLPAGRPTAIARRGVARTFQTPIMPQSMTTAETVSVARKVHDRVGILSTILRLPKFRRVAKRDETEARAWLAAVGLAGEDDVLATSQPLGNRRLVEVARALATGSTVLLLDEPASGLDVEDVQRFSELLVRLRDAGATIVLVEHNFDLVCDIADKIYVLERGKLIASGPPSLIQSDDAVARSYLGEEFSASVTGDGEQNMEAIS